MYANHAAEEAAHSYGVGMSPDEVYQEVADHLPEAYSSDMTITRGAGDSVSRSSNRRWSCRFFGCVCAPAFYPAGCCWRFVSCP